MVQTYGKGGAMIAVAFLVALFWSFLAWIVGLWWPLCAAIGVGVFTFSWLAMALCAVGARRERP